MAGKITGDLENPLMVLPAHVHDLRYAWQGDVDKRKKVINGFRHGQPIDKYGQFISLFATDLITTWDEDVVKKVIAFRDMVNLIERLKEGLEKDWQNFKKELPELEVVNDGSMVSIPKD